MIECISKCGVYRVTIHKNKTFYTKKGNLHRDGNLPAVEYADGRKEYWKNGKRHRDGDLPAVDCADGTKEWWQNGKLHRDGDLPAIEWADGYKEYWKGGVKYSPPKEIKNIVLSQNEEISISFNDQKITIVIDNADLKFAIEKV